MPVSQPLRPYALAAGVALGLYIMINLALFLVVTRAAPAPAAESPVAAASTAAPPAASAAGETAAAAFTLIPGAGDWAQEGGAVIQRSAQLADLFAGTDLSGSQYTASVTVQWPADAADTAEMGGGLIFAMQSPGELAGAQMVRFHKGGQELLWGHFGDGGAFQGEGGIGLSLAAGEPHTLAVTIKEGVFDVTVDGETVATQLPLGRQSGGLGLIAYGGPITFTDLRTAQ